VGCEWKLTVARVFSGKVSADIAINISRLVAWVNLTLLILHFIYICLYYNSSCLIPELAPLKSGMTIIFTTKLVQPVKCCVRCPAPVSGLYCSHANPVRSHSLKTLSTRFFRSFV